MIDTGKTGSDPLERERMVVVADRFHGRGLAADLRDRYPEFSVTSCDNYLSGIVEISQQPVRTVVACVDPTLERLDQALAGLRLAAGPKARIVLCCTPESEPQARRALASGADDYVLYPLNADEIDGAIACPRIGRSQQVMFSAAPRATLDELVKLGETIATIGGKPMALIEKLAELIRMALGSRGVTVIVEGAVASSGDSVTKPVLTAPVIGDEVVIGQVLVGERGDSPYTPADTDKLNHYATIAGHILKAASKQREWSQLAVTDECSGLPNRRYLHMRLDEVLHRAAAEQFQVTLLMFDVDDFKRYNDTFGHDAGDEILRLTGELIRKHCRDQDVVARYGGDEFAVVFWEPQGTRVAGSSHPQCALGVLDRFRDALRSEPFPKLGPSGTGKLTISGGLATYPWDGSTRESLIKKADEALLAAKRAGKNRIFLIGEGDTEELNTL